MAAVANPFQNLELKVPAADWEAVRRLTTTFRSEDGSRADPDKSPFQRYVDLWWTGLCIGVSEGRRTKPDQWHKFNDGGVLSSDPWRISQLQLLALGVVGSADVLGDPGQIISLANEFAATGLPILVDEVTGKNLPIMAATELIRARSNVVPGRLDESAQ